MAIVFPASPNLNEIFTEGSISYKCVGTDPIKWIGLGVTPADRLVEGSNKLEIDGSNNLVWTGNNVSIGTGNTTQKLNVGGNISIQESGVLYFNASSGFSPRIANSTSINDLSLFTNNLERLRITSGGVVRVGETTESSTSTRLLVYEQSGNGQTIEVKAANTGGVGSQPGIRFTAPNNDNIGAVYGDVNSDSLQFSTGATERLRITSGGEVTKPYQPLAVIGTNQNNYAPAAGDNLPFNVAETDIGSNYDTSTYKFTCPVAGNYMVILTHASTRWLGDLELMRDDIVIRTLELRAIGVNNAGAADWASRSYSFIIPCTVGQELHWRCSAVYTSIGSNPYLLDGQSTINSSTVYTRYDSATYYLVG